MPYIVSDRKDLPIASVLELYRHAEWAKDRTERAAEEALRGASLVVSLWDGERLVAMARVLSDFVFRAAIYDVIVHPHVRGRGVGRQLMAALLGHPALARVPVFHLLTRDKREFYKKVGFSETTRSGLDALMLTRPVA